MPETRIYHGAGAVRDVLAGLNYIFVVGGQVGAVDEAQR